MHGYTEGITRRGGFYFLYVIAVLIELIFLFVQLNRSIYELRVNGSLDGCLF